LSVADVHIYTHIKAVVADIVLAQRILGLNALTSIWRCTAGEVNFTIVESGIESAQNTTEVGLGKSNSSIS